MKTFLRSLLIIICFTFTSTALATENTKHHEESIYTHVAIGSDAIVQDTQIITQDLRATDNNQGFYIYNQRGDRYHTSVETSRYSEDFKAYQGIIGSANGYKIQSSDITINTSWRRDTSRMRMRRVKSSSEVVQRNDNYPEGNYYKSKGNHYSYRKSTQLFSKGISKAGLDSHYNHSRISC